MFKLAYPMVVATALVAASGLEIAGSRSARADEKHRPHPQYDLFYNYYADGRGSVPVQMYVSPRPTPPMVGHTAITYQPLLPHEFLYPHHRTYRRYDRVGRPANTTRVHYW